MKQMLTSKQNMIEEIEEAVNYKEDPLTHSHIHKCKIFKVHEQYCAKASKQTLTAN
jgi:hypothetical protein